MDRIIDKIKYIENHSEIKRSAYCDGKTHEPIFKHRIINEEMWQELKKMIKERFALHEKEVLT